MILDGHIHIFTDKGSSEEVLTRMQSVGIGGGVLLSRPPSVSCSVDCDGLSEDPKERLDDLMRWTDVSENLYPFYWIYPLADDALEQVEQAVERGVAGFKVICANHYPGDKKALPVYEAIAKANRPILFHSGILWDGRASSIYNRPAEFEPLLEIPKLRFALAHVSWPWCDESIAVYGKFLNALSVRSDVSSEMFIDLTPGTPRIYRNEVLTKLHRVGYDIENNLIYGTDSCANDYNANWAREWIDRDNEIYQELELTEATIEKIYGGNLQRLMGVSPETIVRISPKPGE
jgi:predicted TIM-barrel fold metal-dependent hydrolase